MTRTPTGLAAALIVCASWPTFAQERCEPAKCLEAIRARADVRLVALPAADVAGLWTNGDGGLSGESLYLFPDGSFVYTEWADIQPETIYDKGTWRLESGVLDLSPDTDITWKQTWERRYLLVRLGSDRGSPVLMGIDDGPGLVRRTRLDERGSRARKAALFPGAWRPGWFADPDSDTTRRSREQVERARDLFDKAERVEAVATTPIRLDATTGRALSDLLTLFDWNGGSLGACAFEPDVTFRFVKGDRAAQVHVSFACGEMVLDGVEGPAGGRKMLEGSERRELLRAARKAFPRKFEQVRQ